MGLLREVIIVDLIQILTFLTVDWMFFGKGLNKFAKEISIQDIIIFSGYTREAK